MISLKKIGLMVGAVALAVGALLMFVGCLGASWSTSKGHYVFVPCRPGADGGACLNLGPDQPMPRAARAVITANPADESVWLTESRLQVRWYGAPVGQQPADVTFLTQAECEQFRAAHPSFTKPDEHCVQLYVHRE